MLNEICKAIGYSYLVAWFVLKKMAVAFNRRNIFEVFFAIKLFLLICLFSGCSQKAIYFFSPQAQISHLTKSDSISVFKTATIQESLGSSETVGLSTKKLKIETLEAIATDKFAATETQTNCFNFPTSYSNPSQLFSSSSKGTKSLKVTKDRQQNIELKLANAKAKFPMPLFLALTFILAVLIALHILLDAGSQGPSVEGLLGFAIIPLAIWWLYLAFKGLGILVAPLLGWSVFWASIAIFVVTFGLVWVIVRLVNHIEGLLIKRKRKRYEKKKDQQKESQPLKWEKGLGS